MRNASRRVVADCRLSPRRRGRRANTPGFDADTRLANELADVGVILLMFGVGLHFHIRDLLAVRRVAAPGALGQILVTTLVAGAVMGFAVRR
jgi:CPA2 family monovalent cation:H+ antiporter-2